MQLIANTYSPQEFETGFSYAFIDLDPKTAGIILERKKQFDAIHDAPGGESLTAIEYRDYTAVFLGALPELDGIEAPNCDNGGDFDEIHCDSEVFEQYQERTDCNRMVITEGSVYWTAIPHYADRSHAVETTWIDYETVRAAALEPVIS